MPESINLPRQRIGVEKIGVQDEPRGSIRPYVTERGRLGGRVFTVEPQPEIIFGKKLPGKKRGTIPPAKDHGAEMREHTLYVTERMSRGPLFMPKIPSGTGKLWKKTPRQKKGNNPPAQDHGAEKKGYSENGREHTTVCDRTIEEEGSPFYARKPQPVDFFFLTCYII